jgi:hypothetical protein
MDMLVAFQSGMTTRLNFKIPPLNRESFRAFKQYLARHILVGAAFLIGQQRDIFPRI